MGCHTLTAPFALPGKEFLAVAAFRLWHSIGVDGGIDRPCLPTGFLDPASSIGV
jgi:hypothetical protein